MLRSGKKFTRRDPVAPELVGEEPIGGLALRIQSLAEKPLCSPRVAFTLYEDVEHASVLVDCPPKVVDITIDIDKHFVGVPLVAESSLAALERTPIPRPKFQTQRRIVS